MIKSTFSFFEMVMEPMFLNAFHLAQPQFGLGPERFDTVDMRRVIRKFMAAMFYSKMLGITDIDEAMITAPEPSE